MSALSEKDYKKTRKVIKYFIRFLKENDKYSAYCEEFNRPINIKWRKDSKTRPNVLNVEGFFAEHNTDLVCKHLKVKGGNLFIDSVLCWDGTKLGHTFWYETHEEWINFYRKKNFY